MSGMLPKGHRKAMMTPERSISNLPLVVGEVTGWQGHAPDQVKAMKEGIALLKEQGGEVVE